MPDTDDTSQVLHGIYIIWPMTHLHGTKITDSFKGCCYLWSSGRFNASCTRIRYLSHKNTHWWTLCSREWAECSLYGNEVPIFALLPIVFKLMEPPLNSKVKIINSYIIDNIFNLVCVRNMIQNYQNHFPSWDFLHMFMLCEGKGVDAFWHTGNIRVKVTGIRIVIFWRTWEDKHQNLHKTFFTMKCWGS